jgi:4-amino-4-deoxy-L-arabinose transferase-like glycosyltransferase
MTTGSVGVGRGSVGVGRPSRRGTAAAEAHPHPEIAPALWFVALALVAVELAVSAQYGFHRDELYFIVAGHRPALGYIDQPPFAPLLTRLATAVFGFSPTAIRVFPALAGGGVVVLAGLTARALGGRALAQVLSGVAVACAPVLLAAAHLANTTVYDLLAWSAIVLFVVLAVNDQRPRLWVAAGAVAGVGLENKDLLLVLVAALAVGLVATGRWRELIGPWQLAGVAVALALWAPNLVWQAQHNWPQITMSRALHEEHSTGSDYAGVLPAQLLYIGLATVPLAVVGVRRLVKRPELRFLAIAVALVLAFVVIEIPGRPYYTDGLMPVVFAAGAVSVEQRRRQPGRWLVPPALLAIVTLPLVLPVLPVSVVGEMPFLHKLNYDLGETVGWPQLTTAVAGVYRSLPAASQRSASVFTANYGEAGALLLYGPRFHLPPAISGHNNFWIWGPDHQSDTVVIAVGSAGQLRPYFGSCTAAAVFHSPEKVNNDENGVVLSVCTRPQASWGVLWPRLRHYD